MLFFTVSDSLGPLRVLKAPQLSQGSCHSCEFNEPVCMWDLTVLTPFLFSFKKKSLPQCIMRQKVTFHGVKTGCKTQTRSVSFTWCINIEPFFTTKKVLYTLYRRLDFSMKRTPLDLSAVFHWEFCFFYINQVLKLHKIAQSVDKSIRSDRESCTLIHFLIWFGKVANSTLLIMQNLTHIVGRCRLCFQIMANTSICQTFDLISLHQNPTADREQSAVGLWQDKSDEPFK